MGRSPVLATSTRAVLRPALISISESASRYSPGCVLCDWVMYRHQFCAIGEGCLHLDLVNHFRDAVHYIFALQDGFAVRHDIGDAYPIVSRFNNLRSKND